MLRRNFLAGLSLLPFVGVASALTAKPVPVEDKFVIFSSSDFYDKGYYRKHIETLRATAYAKKIPFVFIRQRDRGILDWRPLAMADIGVDVYTSSTPDQRYFLLKNRFVGKQGLINSNSKNKDFGFDVEALHRIISKNV